MSDTKYQGDTNAVVNPLDKGLGALEAACAPEQIAAQRWNVLSEDLNLPVAVLSQSRLEHNLAWMQRFVGEYGASRWQRHTRRALPTRMACVAC